MKLSTSLCLAGLVVSASARPLFRRDDVYFGDNGDSAIYDSYNTDDSYNTNNQDIGNTQNKNSQNANGDKNSNNDQSQSGGLLTDLLGNLLSKRGDSYNAGSDLSGATFGNGNGASDSYNRGSNVNKNDDGLVTALLGNLLGKRSGGDSYSAGSDLSGSTFGNGNGASDSYNRGSNVNKNDNGLVTALLGNLLGKRSGGDSYSAGSDLSDTTFGNGNGASDSYNRGSNVNENDDKLLAALLGNLLSKRAGDYNFGGNGDSYTKDSNNINNSGNTNNQDIGNVNNQESQNGNGDKNSGNSQEYNAGLLDLDDLLDGLVKKRSNGDTATVGSGNVRGSGNTNNQGIGNVNNQDSQNGNGDKNSNNDETYTAGLLAALGL